MLNIVDEFTRACLAIKVARQFKAADVIEVLADLCSSRVACPSTPEALVCSELPQTTPIQRERHVMAVLTHIRG
jgi:hypothetical protein